MRELIDHHGHVPETCVWEITRACNLRCHHCGSLAGKRRPGELSTAECVRVARELAALGTRLITLSGGEPTLRADWPVIARAAIEAGVTVNMVTNGQSQPEVLAQRAREVGLANVAVSLDGLEVTHDAIRTPGSFARVCRTISTLAAAGIWVDVMFTVNRWNLGELEATYELAEALGARGFRAQLGKPMGAQTGRDDLTLIPRDLLTLMPRLGRLAKGSGPRVMIGDSLGYYSQAERELRGRRSAEGHWTGCYAGCRAIGIQSDGSVKGCLSLQPRAGEADPFIEGNVRDQPLSEIWNRPGAFAYNREFTVDALRGACARCSHGSICRGGAKCVAHAYTGGVGSDPMCHLAALRAEGSATKPLPASAAAAAAAILMAIGAGCGSGVETGKGGSGGTSTSGSGGTTTTGSGGTTTTTTGDAGTDAAVDCSQVCCDCDYGVPPAPEVFKACCCLNVCCECDYGVPPPAGCCQ